MFYRWLFPSLWLAFVLFWIAMARCGKPVAERESAFSRLSHYLPLAIAIYLLSSPHVPFTLLNDRFAPLSLWLVRLGAALTIAGIAFAIWARVWIAGNWSSDVTLKRNHELITSGPYRWVRLAIRGPRRSQRSAGEGLTCVCVTAAPTSRGPLKPRRHAPGEARA